MNKINSIGTVVVMALLFAASHQSIAGYWYVGGTLYDATVNEWHKASPHNKLATAAHWALMQQNIRKISNKSSSMETVKPYAIELVACVDQISAGENNTDNDVSSLAAFCMGSMGW